MNPGGLINRFLSTLGIEQTIEMRGFFGAWLVLTLFCYPYVYLPVAARFRQLPRTLEESLQYRMIPNQNIQENNSPSAGPVIAAGTLIVFLYTISDFGAVQLMPNYDTLAHEAYSRPSWLINQWL